MIKKEVKVSLLYELENLHHVVVQVAYVDGESVYAL
ncbi:class III bacteriocin [Lactobacillus delbrueckii subsp. sunkii]|nr:class III bacteriocin [Lactobacillus delbrueckii]MCD5518377.1 class III bacteriocin [Lactobacillus delbrueckii subsp. sunkii]MCZ0777236.1 class III bacteriocin [Lactobacillus delbrueckii subsp. sunkii]MCZ0787836.1 class III bacteriocin [Lactobacillus delbrueckii subsp. sunkii]MCZ0794348.1 class III bacteriocin [Lactobacillus delbrueckii]